MNQLLKTIATSALLVFAFGAFAKADVDVKKSTFKWEASKKIGSKHFGKIYLKSAKAEVKDGKIQSGEFVMDMGSFTVDDLKGSMQQKFLGHVKSEDFFEVKKFPTAKLIIDKQTSDKEVEGKLTIKGKTNPVKVKFTKKGNKYSGTLTFDRTKWGVIYGSGNFFKELAADKIISNDVKLDFAVVVNKAGKKDAKKKK